VGGGLVPERGETGVIGHGKILVLTVLTGTNCTNSGTEGVKRKYPTH
jgi:hypothetical protein